MLWLLPLLRIAAAFYLCEITSVVTSDRRGAESLHLLLLPSCYMSLVAFLSSHQTHVQTNSLSETFVVHPL